MLAQIVDGETLIKAVINMKIMITEKSVILRGNGNFLPLRPRRLISLWDMIHWSAQHFGTIWVWTEKKRTMAHNAVKEAGRNSQVDGVENGLVVRERMNIYKCLEDFLNECNKLELHSTFQRAEELMVQVGNPHKPCYWSDIETGLTGIQWAIEHELTFRHFAYIPQAKVDYFENDGEFALFGIRVFKNFKSARSEIKNAGNSIAADLYDAAIFYLMRTVEIGLRDLARSLKVKIPKTPLDYAGWKDVVIRIDKNLEAKIPRARGPRQAAALKFKHDLLADFKAFEVLRNEVMHGRSHFNEQEAIGLFNRVRDFMRRLDGAINPARH